MALRGAIGFLLVLAIALTASAYMFHNLTIHDTGQAFFGKMIATQITQELPGEDLNRSENQARFDCRENGVAYVNISKAPLKLDCSKMDKIPFSQLLANSVYDQMYYNQYACTFFDCFGKTGSIPALISQQNHMRYLFYYWYLLAIDAILAVLLFFVSSTWLKRAGAFGYVLLISGLGALPFFVTLKIFSAEMAFMNNILYAQIAMFVMGVVLLVLAMIFKPRHKKEEKYEENEDEDNS